MDLSKLQKTIEDRGAWRAAAHGVAVRHNLAAEQQIRGIQNTTQISLSTKQKQKHKHRQQTCDCQGGGGGGQTALGVWG